MRQLENFEGTSLYWIEEMIERIKGDRHDEVTNDQLIHWAETIKFIGTQLQEYYETTKPDSLIDLKPNRQS